MVVVLTFLFSCLHYLHIRLLFCLFPFSSKLWLRYFFLSYLYLRLSLLILVLFLVGRNCCLLVFLSFLPVSSSFSFSFPCWSKLCLFLSYTFACLFVFRVFMSFLPICLLLSIPSSSMACIFFLYPYLRPSIPLYSIFVEIMTYIFFLSLLIPSSVYILLFHLRRNYGLDIFLPLLPTSPSVSSPCPLPSSLKSLPTWDPNPAWLSIPVTAIPCGRDNDYWWRKAIRQRPRQSFRTTCLPDSWPLACTRSRFPVAAF